MADLHNISDLRAIRLLQKELLDVRNELRQAAGYDPTESLADNVGRMISVGQYFTKRCMDLRKELSELKKEQENDKNVARSYPITGGDADRGRVGGNPAPSVSRTVAGYDGAGHSIADPFSDYHPSRESVSERLLGSADGYGR